MEEHIFPRKDADFHTYITVGIPYLDTNKIRLLISAPNVTAMLASKTAWDLVWGKYIDEAQNTKIVTGDKNTARQNFETLLTTIYEDIPDSVLNSTDREKLNLKLRDLTPTQQDVLNTPPLMVIDRSGHWLHVLRFRNPATPDSNAMPLGQKVLLQRYIGVAGLTPPNIIWSEGLAITKALNEITFDEADQGKTVYYRSCYVNTRGQKGTVGDLISRVIS